MDENADASQAICEPPPENWRRPPRTTGMKNIHDDLSSLDLEIHEARDLVQNRPVCRLMSLHSTTHSWWLGSRVVSVLDSGAEGRGFKS